MNRHSFRWSGVTFGILFLAIVGNWAVWQGDLLTGRQLSWITSGALIVAGVVGVVATLRRPSVPVAPPVVDAVVDAPVGAPGAVPTDTDTDTSEESSDDQTTDTHA